MGTYRVPRNTKGESRILIIFSTKALIYTVIGIVIGYMFNFIFKMMGMQTVGIIIMAILGLIGFLLASLKIPEIGALPITREIAGEHIDEIIIRYFKFKKKSKKIYIAEKLKKNNQTKEEESKNDR